MGRILLLLPGPHDRRRHGAARHDAHDGVFVQAAIMQMMALASPLTIATYGLEDIHDKYNKNYVPRFRGATVEWDKEFVLFGDETGNRGIRVSGLLKGEKPYRISLGVMREGGKHVIISFDAKRPHDATGGQEPDRS